MMTQVGKVHTSGSAIVSDVTKDNAPSYLVSPTGEVRRCEIDGRGEAVRDRRAGHPGQRVRECHHGGEAGGFGPRLNKGDATMKKMWKVPLRQVYCGSFGSMLKQTLWCHVVVRVFPHAYDLAADALRDDYRANPMLFWEQYKGVFDSLPPLPRFDERGLIN